MKRALLPASLLLLAQSYAAARGVSPYLPLHLDPTMERRIERVLILADQPALRRPITAATVLDALPAACRKDVVLCEEVRRYLRVYQKDYGITFASIEGASSHDTDRPVPNRYGL